MKNRFSSSSIALCFALISFFSCEESKNTSSETLSMQNDTVTKTETIRTDSDSSEYREQWKQESEDIKAKLERLREKAKQKGGEAQKNKNGTDENDVGDRRDDSQVWSHEKTQGSSSTGTPGTSTKCYRSLYEKQGSNKGDVLR